MIHTLRAYGWNAIELGLIAVAACVILHVILGAAGGPVVNAVSANAIALLQALPPGVTVGVSLVVVVERIVRARLR